MGSFTRKAGIAAAAATIGLGMSALPASADKDHAEKKRITTVTMPVCVSNVSAVGALNTAFTAAIAATATITNIVLQPNCNYPLTAALAATSATNVHITGSTGSVITAVSGARHATIATGGTLRFYNLTLLGISTAATGGIANTGGSLTVYNCTLTLNRAVNGGAILNTSSGNTSVYNSTINANVATAGDGGGISSTSGPLYVENTRITANTATGDGGGINFANGVATLTNDLISGNTAAGDGGGTYNGEKGLTNGYGSLWTGNTATGDGGGVASIDGFYGRSIGITNNSGTNGGGFYNAADTDSMVTLGGHAYVRTNAASGVGGGIENMAPNTVGQAVVSDVDVTGNTPTDCVNVTGCT